ncbi:helix-turn-helix domain-containing protein [Eoetvoesiella caeni]
MNYDLECFSQCLREARTAKSLSQRDLSKLAGVPQSHISKIESNQVDLRLSSLIAIANALDLELALVPRQAMPAIQSITRQAASQSLHVPSRHQPLSEPRPAYSLDDEDEP